MALSFSSSSLLISEPACPSTFSTPIAARRACGRRGRGLIRAVSSSGDKDEERSTKLVTFLGKGGSGKTTSAVFAAQHFAMAGLKTCLVIHSPDTTAEYLLNCKIGTSPIRCKDNLSAVRLETTKMLLEPLKQLQEADSRLNMTNGVLKGVVGEELGVLPGMDSTFSALELERYVRFLWNESQGKQREIFDMIVYDGISTEETLRMIGAPSKARLYLKYFRSIAEKTDLGRLVGPSVLSLIDEAMSLTGIKSTLNGSTSARIWDALDKMLERGTSAFSDPHKFRCFLVVDPQNPASVDSALRYWGSTIQAGALVSGAFGIAHPNEAGELTKRIKETFAPMQSTFIPHLSFTSPADWDAIMSNSSSNKARELLSLPASSISMPSVKFDPTKKSVTLLLPGYDKSEIKLYQYRGGSELLVEAGDQRRVIHLPPNIQGKVGGAKFVDRSLVITMR
ncbi:uncharacterized protein At1g26090, chloroplastic [Syzygium oleosum]|uniref:uncharacterized protein At1g26090, chloroplastic n=1 Tax=Syzygium oleosum TaxID=219896 RepID=UPI0024B91C0B|nr:uncharacterized protein At1g26090, chloroplastic [Syzygium oleosum]